MATTREELVLVDRFSATFGQFLNLMARAAGAGKAAAASQKQFEGAARMAGTSLDQMAGAAAEAATAQERLDSAVDRSASSANKLGDAAGKASRNQDKMNRSMNQGQNSAARLERRMLGLAKAYLSLRTAQAFVGLSNTMTQTTARLDRMNDGLQTTAQLQDMIYQAAQRSRGNYQETVDMVGKLGTMAGEAFSSSAELVAFAEQINKQFKLAGTSTQGAQAAMLQLTQAMSSGVLRGEELNSVLEQAPTIAQAIAKYMGVSVGQMREMASEGKITAQVVKDALFAAADETNAAFESIPLTFSQAWTMAGNATVNSFRPALQKLNDLLNSELGQKAVNGLIAGFELLGSAAEGVVDLMAAGAQLVADNWNLVAAVLSAAAGVAMLLAAKMVLAGAASVASALASAAAWALAHWPLIALIGLAAAAGIAAQEMGLTFEDVFSGIGAVAGGLFAFGYNLVASAWNLLASFAEFFANFLNDPSAAIAHLLADLADFALSVLQNIAGAIDAVFGSNLSSAVNGWRNNVQDWANTVAGEKRVQIERMAMLDIGGTAGQWSSAAGGMGRALDNFSVNDILGGFSGTGTDFSAMLDASGIPGSLEAIGKDTAAIKRSVSLSEEDMKLLVDMAERQYINNIRLTAQTPIINVTGQNTGDTELDRQRLADALQTILLEQAASHTDRRYR